MKFANKSNYIITLPIVKTKTWGL